MVPRQILYWFIFIVMALAAGTAIWRFSNITDAVDNNTPANKGGLVPVEAIKVEKTL